MKQTKQGKKLLSFVLILALSLSILGGPISAKAEGSATSVTVTLRIEQDDATLLSPVSVTLTEEDKNNDFGIGLSTGDAAAFSPLRAYAKYLLEKGVKKEEMSKYIMASPSDWGGLYVTGLSVSGDGIGSASSENHDNVYWMYAVNNESGAVSMSEYALKQSDSVVIYGIWSPYPAEEEILYTAFDKETYQAVNNTSDIVLTGYGTSYDEQGVGTPYQKPITGATITATDTADSDTVLTIQEKTDENGKASMTFPALEKEATYVLTAEKKSTDGTHYVISRPYAVVTVPAAATSAKKKPARVTSVKASVKKSKGNKKKIKLSWGKVKKADGYQIYISSKKKSGYKKMAESKKTSATILRKKGIWYVKIRAYRKESGKKTTGKFSSICKIKVK